jgi:hypothetical protein
VRDQLGDPILILRYGISQIFLGSAFPMPVLPDPCIPGGHRVDFRVAQKLLDRLKYSGWAGFKRLGQLEDDSQARLFLSALDLAQIASVNRTSE